jgi:hypothetical protein
VHYSGVVRNLATDLPVEGVVAHFCASSDETCSDPVRPRIEAPDGVLEFEISGRFNGYIKLESPTMLPAIIELWNPIGAMRMLSDFRMVAPESFALFAATMDASVAPDTGHALYWVDDCDGERAADVSIQTADTTSETKQYYVIGTRLPSLTVDRTDDSGAGGFINLPTRFVTFTAHRASTGQRIAQLSARIRSGTTTFFVIEPR